MPDNWISALNSYSYPVNFDNFSGKQAFPGFFEKNISGDKSSTEEFEKEYQKNAPQNLAAFFEVIYWSYYSQPLARDSKPNDIIRNILNSGIKSRDLWDSVTRFIQSPGLSNMQRIRHLISIRSPVIFTPLVLVALADPDRYPLVNKDIAKWVNGNLGKHNSDRTKILTKFFLNFSSLQENDFQNYLNWTEWTRETAQILSTQTKMKWRARDVEMAVYAAQKNRIELEVISTRQTSPVLTEMPTTVPRIFEPSKKIEQIDRTTKDLEDRIKRFSKVPDSRSRFVKAGDVKQYEMTFIGRTEKKIGKPGVRIEIRGVPFIVEGIFENKGTISDKYIDQIKRPLTKNEIKNLPENRYLTVKLVEKKLLGHKKRYTFCSLFRSRPQNYADFGFDTEPLTINDINPILDKVLEVAKRIGEPFFLCVASPTGFVPELRDFIDNKEFHKNFLSRYLSVCFLDLETAKLIFNPSDEVTKSFLPYCEMMIESEKMEKIRVLLSQNIDEQFQQKSYAEYSLALESCQYAGLRDEDLVKAAFYQYGDDGGAKVRYAEGVGLVMIR